MILTSVIYLAFALVGALAGGAFWTVTGIAAAAWAGTLIVWWELRAALRESGHAPAGNRFLWSGPTGRHARQPAVGRGHRLGDQ